MLSAKIKLGPASVIESINSTIQQNPIDLSDTDIAAFIPLRLDNKDIVDHDIKLLENTINTVQSSKYIDKIFNRINNTIEYLGICVTTNLLFTKLINPMIFGILQINKNI